MDEVGHAAEKIPSHLECAICWKLLLEPVSVPCGHTFCQGCLNQALGYRNVCSVCRAPVPPGQAVNILIRSMIAEQYPRALAQRRQEQQEELLEAEQNAQLQRQTEVRGEGQDPQDPRDPEVFILPILRSGMLVLPQSRMDQELVSAQDEELVQFTLQGGRRVCLLQDGEDLGICMTVDDFRPRLGNHMSRAKLVGKFRARIIEPPQLHEGGFELGRFQAVFDTPLPLNELAELGTGEPAEEETTAAIARKCIELMEAQLEMLGSSSRYVFTENCGELPPLFRRRPGSAVTSADMEVFSFWLLGAIMMDMPQRTRLRKSTDTKERLLGCHATLQAGGSRCILNLPGADSWMHPRQSPWSSMVLLLMIFALLLAKACGFFDSVIGRQRSLQSNRIM